MGGEAVFTSHPNKELLKIHDPEKFGCTPCHGGNGVALSSVEKAHGYNKYWLWPLHHKENIEAGCQQCHAKEIVTEMADTLNAGREIFRLRGCMGCHRYEGFDREADEMSVGQPADPPARAAEGRVDCAKPASPSRRATIRAPATPKRRSSTQHANDLKVRSSGLDAKIEQLDMRSRSLVREVKKVGPSLKEVRMKLHKEWIPVWLKDPHDWREGTKMPTFRLDDDEIRADRGVHLAIRRAGRPAAAEARRPGEGQGSFRNPRLHGLPFHGRRRPEAGRHVRRQPEPRRREGQLRLPGALGSQSAPAHRALLPVREEGPHRRRLQEAQPALTSSIWSTTSAPTTATSCRCSR